MEDKSFKTVITPKKGLFDLGLKELFKYKDLIRLFVKRDFISQYKQTVLGPLWAVIQPLLTTLAFFLIFGQLAGLPTTDTLNNDVLPSFLFFFAGNICFGYFSSTVNATSQTFIYNRYVMSKVYFPRLVTPISTAISRLISFAIQFALFLIMWAVYLIIGGYDIKITLYLLFIPLIVLELMVISVGVGLIVSSLTTKFRDLQMLVSFGLTLWQYATPVAYGLALVSENEIFTAYMLNPLTPIVTTFRKAMFGVGYFDIKYYLIGWGISLLLLFIGVLLFSKREKNFVDTI